MVASGAREPAPSAAPELVVLDVNQTLSDLAPLEDVFVSVGLASHEVEAWFSGVLRDGFALTVLGENPGFADLAAEAVRGRVRRVRPEASRSELDQAADAVVSTFGTLRPHPDVLPGLRELREAGCRVVTLSNGSAAVARRLLADTTGADEHGVAGEGLVERYLSVADAGVWKPAAGAYEHALHECGVRAGAAMLVAVHPWDLEGARRAGLRTAYVDRGGGGYPAYFAPPELAVPTLADLAGRLRG